MTRGQLVLGKSKGSVSVLCLPFAMFNLHLLLQLHCSFLSIRLLMVLIHRYIFFIANTSLQSFNFVQTWFFNTRFSTIFDALRRLYLMILIVRKSLFCRFPFFQSIFKHRFNILSVWYIRYLLTSSDWHRMHLLECKVRRCIHWWDNGRGW